MPKKKKVKPDYEKGNKTAQYHLNITKELNQKLDEEAKIHGIKRSEYIRFILHNHLRLERVIDWCVEEINKIKSSEQK